MKHHSTQDVVKDLTQHGHLLVIEDEIDPYLELAEIHRRVYRRGGPALLFKNVRGTRFPVVSNLFGTLDRARFLFRDTIESVKMAVRWKTDPASALKQPFQLWRAPLIASRMRARRVRRGPLMDSTCSLEDLPKVVCWPKDGGPFVTLPQVLSQRPGCQNLGSINLGMYRVQLSGNEYLPNQECGLHYQIHRGIGVHHTEAKQLKRPFPVNVTVGGTPAMTVGAVMPLPEGMSELTFAGALAGFRIPVATDGSTAPFYAEADFGIVGSVNPEATKPEGPFGDHLGYYAKVHEFPVLKVDRVWHRKDAIWPITVVGRPPQEDTTFGELIHEITEPVIPTVLPGVKEVHAVDESGVHPLLLAMGSERYTPYSRHERPQELLTQACAILGQGQLSLAKYLFIVNGGQDGVPSVRQVPEFFDWLLRRADWQRDLHFHTCTTIDTLDYSGTGLNQGSKLVVAAAGEPIRELETDVSATRLPPQWSNPRTLAPGILVVEANQYRDATAQSDLQATCDQLESRTAAREFPLIVIVDDSDFAARNWHNFLWTTFTRSNPAADVYGIGAFTRDKHFGCRGSLVIDARSKPHHADGLIEDPETSKKVDARASRGGHLAEFL